MNLFTIPDRAIGFYFLMIENILTYSIGSLFWGIVIALICIGLFLLLIKGWYKDAYFKPVSYIIAGALCLVLIYNCTIICGAIAMKSDIELFEGLVSRAITSSFPDFDITVDERTSNEILQKVLEEHPILYYYVGSCNFEGWRLSELPHVMGDTLKSYLNNVILKNILWSLGFVVAGAILAIKTIGRSGKVSIRSDRDNRHNFSRRSARSHRTYVRRR